MFAETLWRLCGVIMSEFIAGHTQTGLFEVLSEEQHRTTPPFRAAGGAFVQKLSSGLQSLN